MDRGPGEAEAAPNRAQVAVTAPARLRVGYDATALLGNQTGVGRWASDVLFALARRDDLELAAFAVSYRQEGLAALLPGGVLHHQRPMAARPLQFCWSHWSRPKIETFVGKLDVVHGTNFVVPPTRRAGRVVTVHDLTMVRFPQLATEATLRFDATVRRAVRTGAFVHTHTAAIAAEVIEHFGAAPDRVRVVAPGVPVLATAAEVDIDRLLPPGVDRYVLAIGTAEPRKDLPGLVAAFDQLAAEDPGLGLVLVGQDGWGVQALEAAIDAAKAHDRICRLGFLDDAVLSAVLRGASVLAYPSLYEGFGFPPLQAMAANVAVVATSTPVAREVLGDAAILVPPGATGELAHALDAVLNQVALRRDLVVRGRRRVARYDLGAAAAGLAQLYHDAAAG